MSRGDAARQLAKRRTGVGNQVRQLGFTGRRAMRVRTLRVTRMGDWFFPQCENGRFFASWIFLRHYSVVQEGLTLDHFNLEWSMIVPGTTEYSLR